MTRVDEWTNAETGVGAAIAAGNHLEKGIWALLVIAARHKNIIIHGLMEFAHTFIIFHWPLVSIHPIETRIKTSPIRFVKAVIIPAPRDLGE